MPGKLTHRYTMPKSLSDAAVMFPKASSAALNRVTRSARTQVSREIRQTYNIKASDVAEVIQVIPSSSGRLTAYLKVTGSRLALAMFGARQTAAGVSVMIKKGSRKVLRGSFMATMKSGHVGVFTRKGKERLPIEEKLTIGMPQMFTSRSVRSKLLAYVEQNLPEELGRTIKAFRELGRE